MQACPNPETITTAGEETLLSSPMGIASRVNGQLPPEMALDDINLGTFEFWGMDDSLRDGAFTTLRREAPIKFFHEVEFEGIEAGPGHWALTKLDDVFYASRHPEIFSSYPNITQRNGCFSR